MGKEYVIEREYARFENNVKVIKKENEFTPEELNEIRLRNQKRYLKAYGYRGITAEEYAKRNLRAAHWDALKMGQAVGRKAIAYTLRDNNEKFLCDES